MQGQTFDGAAAWFIVEDLTWVSALPGARWNHNFGASSQRRQHPFTTPGLAINPWLLTVVCLLEVIFDPAYYTTSGLVGVWIRQKVDVMIPWTHVPRPTVSKGYVFQGTQRYHGPVLDPSGDCVDHD